jgi:hypothetical protein
MQVEWVAKCHGIQLNIANVLRITTGKHVFLIVILIGIITYQFESCILLFHIIVLNNRRTFQDGMSGKLEQNHELFIHLGGGVYVTVGEHFPTVDIRHFWIPIDSDKSVPSRHIKHNPMFCWIFLGTSLYIITDMYDYFIFIFFGYNVTITSQIKHTPVIITTI